MKEIGGEAKTIRELLSGQRYEIDYYQREYRWQQKQAKGAGDRRGRAKEEAGRDVKFK